MPSTGKRSKLRKGDTQNPISIASDHSQANTSFVGNSFLLPYRQTPPHTSSELNHPPPPPPSLLRPEMLGPITSPPCVHLHSTVSIPVKTLIPPPPPIGVALCEVVATSNSCVCCTHPPPLQQQQQLSHCPVGTFVPTDISHPPPPLPPTTGCRLCDLAASQTLVNDNYVNGATFVTSPTLMMPPSIETAVAPPLIVPSHYVSEMAKSTSPAVPSERYSVVQWRPFSTHRRRPNMTSLRVILGGRRATEK